MSLPNSCRIYVGPEQQGRGQSMVRRTPAMPTAAPVAASLIGLAPHGAQAQSSCATLPLPIPAPALVVGAFAYGESPTGVGAAAIAVDIGAVAPGAGQPLVDAGSWRRADSHG